MIFKRKIISRLAGRLRSEKRVLSIALVVGLLIGCGFGFLTWYFSPRNADAQCTLMYLTAGPNATPACASGGTRISATQSNTSGHHIGLCIR